MLNYVCNCLPNKYYVCKYMPRWLMGYPSAAPKRPFIQSSYVYSINLAIPAIL